MTTNNKENSGFINPATIKSDEKLSDILTQIGFNSRPVPSKDNDIRIIHQTKFINQPQRYLFAQNNAGFQSHALVSIESEAFHVYYYQAENDIFRIWDTLAGDVEIEKIKRTISSAMSEEEILKRFYRDVK